MILPSKDISVPGTVRNMPAEDPQLSQCLGGVSKSPLPSSPTPQIQTTSISNGVTTSISNGVTTRIKRRSHSEQKVKLNQLDSIILKVLIFRPDVVLEQNHYQN